jgi:hypothetical protein
MLMVFMFNLMLVKLRDDDAVVELVKLLQAALHAAATIIISVVVDATRIVMREIETWDTQLELPITSSCIERIITSIH